MTDQFYTNQQVLDRLHGGPLGSYIDGFTAWLYEQGYMKATYQLRTSTCESTGLLDAKAWHQCEQPR